MSEPRDPSTSGRTGDRSSPTGGGWHEPSTSAGEPPAADRSGSRRRPAVAAGSAELGPAAARAAAARPGRPRCGAAARADVGRGLRATRATSSAPRAGRCSTAGRSPTAAARRTPSWPSLVASAPGASRSRSTGRPACCAAAPGTLELVAFDVVYPLGRSAGVPQYAVTAAPLLGAVPGSGCPRPGSGSTGPAGWCRWSAGTRRSTRAGCCCAAEDSPELRRWPRTRVAGSAARQRRRRRVLVRGAVRRRGPAGRPPAALIEHHARPAHGRRRSALRRVRRLTCGRGRGGVFHVELAPAGRSSTPRAGVSELHPARMVATGTRGAHAVTEGVDGGIPVVPPGILDSRNRQQPAQRRSALVPPRDRHRGCAGAGCANRKAPRGRSTRRPRTPTPAVPSPSSRASRRSASAPACTSAPPASAACTTWSRRSSTTRSTRRWPATATPSTSPCSPTAASGSSTTAAASRSTCTRSRSGPPSRSSDRPARRRQVRRQGATRSPAACTASASPSSTRCPRGSRSRVWRGRRRLAPALRPAPSRGPLEEGGPTDEAGTDGHLLGRRRHLRDHRLLASRRSSRRLQEMAFLNKGLTIVLRDERPEQGETGWRVGGEGDEVEHGHLPLRGRHRRLRPAPQRHEEPDPQVGRSSFEAEDASGIVGRDRDAVERRLRRVGLHVRQHHQHARGRHPRGGLPRGADHVVNQYARDKKLLKEKDDKLTGEDIREGLAAIVSVKLGEPQFEGQTKTKLGNTEVKGFVQKVCNDQLGRLVRAQPGRGQDDHHQGVSGRPGPHRGRAGAQAGPAQGPARVRRRCRASWPTASPPTRASRELFIVEGDSAGGSAKARPRPDVPGDPADPRQDPQRREGAHRPGAEEQRGPGADHRARHRHPRRLRHRRSCAITRSS